MVNADRVTAQALSSEYLADWTVKHESGCNKSQDRAKLALSALCLRLDCTNHTSGLTESYLK